MTDKTIWRILDAWRDDPKRVSIASVLSLHEDVTYSNPQPIETMRTLFTYLREATITFEGTFLYKWYIDGKEVTDEVEVECGLD